MRWPGSLPTALWVVGALAVGAAVAAELTRPLAEPVAAVDLSAVGVDPDVLSAARAYRDGLLPLSAASMALRAAVGVVVLLPAVRRRIAGRLRIAADRRALRGRRPPGPLRAGLLGAGVWALSDVVRLPVQVVAWQRSVEAGLSTQDLPAWVRDQVVVLLPYWIGVGLAVTLVAWLVRSFPRTWAPAAGLLIGVTGVVLIYVSPLVFEPVLLRFTPLPEGALRDGIVQLAEAGTGEVPDQVLVADASRRTTTSNAYVSGLAGTRRVVLYDTLLDDAPPEEVLAVVAHELAHTAHRDVERTALSVLATAVVGMAVLQLLFGRRLRDADGRVRPEMAVPVVGAAILAAVALAPAERWASRRAESAADARAIALTGEPDVFVGMMIGLAERNLSDPDPPAWAVGLWYSHPPVGQRIARGLQS